MTNEELIAKIKAEIESRISFHNKGISICTGLNTISLTHSAGLKEDEELLSFLSTLESEKPIEHEGLEEEINRYLEPIHAADIQFEPFTQMTKCARHFAQWGAEHLKK